MDNEGQKSGPKKPYDPPVLTTYGNVRDLTKGVGSTNKPDGPHMNHSTHM